MNETVNIEFNEKNGNFNITSEGRKVAIMTFVFAGPDKIIIDHTEVSPVLTEKDWVKK